MPQQRNGLIGLQSFVAIAAMAIAAMASAENIVYYEPHSGYTETVDTASPGRHAVSLAPQASVGGQARGGSTTFSITYMDVTNNTNVGFDDPTLGATRQATLQAVLSYIATVVNESNGAVIDVTANNSQTDGGGFLATAGTYFSLGIGFVPGYCQEHITTGTDPSGAVPDIQVTVDFGFNWNSDQGAVGGSEYDLYTVLLHEMTHGLGFFGLTSSSGNSTATGGNPGEFMIMNQLTHIDDAGPVGTGSTTALWTTAGGASFVGTAADLISDRLVFTGTNAVAIYGSNPTVYSGNPFISGSSQSHWGDDLASNAVMPRFVFNGVEFRTYADFELGMLVDIGYSNVVLPNADPDTDQDLLSDSVETNTGTFVDENDTGSNPNIQDTDGDGVIDGTEVELGTDPNDPFDFPILPVTVGLALALALGAAGVVAIRYRRRKNAAH